MVILSSLVNQNAIIFRFVQINLMYKFNYDKSSLECRTAERLNRRIHRTAAIHKKTNPLQQIKINILLNVSLVEPPRRHFSIHISFIRIIRSDVLNPITFIRNTITIM